MEVSSLLQGCAVPFLSAGLKVRTQVLVKTIFSMQCWLSHRMLLSSKRDLKCSNVA